MPRNFKEGIIFTLLMCSLMVFGMSSYNYFIATGNFSLLKIITGLPLGLVIAFLLDFLLVGPVAKKFVSKLPLNNESKIQKILAISSSMIVLMVSCMSMFGLIINQIPLSFESYSGIWITNFIFAVPLNLLIVGPLSRMILQAVQNKFDRI